MPSVRIRYRITGIVQGVGFRPTVYRLAQRSGFGGYVCNDSAGVLAVIEGDEKAVAEFEHTLRQAVASEAPLARIDSIRIEGFEPLAGEKTFSITPSSIGEASTMIPPDAATCRACAIDMFSPNNRRWRYAFTNCTHCGPRFTITHHIPYDRAQTSMHCFPMCSNCKAEYLDVTDRRFHAQPNACPVCGPQVILTDAFGQDLKPLDVFSEAIKLIRDGKILAIKGLGGFHLVCDATNATAVESLRARKGRDEKPLAIMTANLVSAQQYVTLSETETEVLQSPEHPIVLAQKIGGCDDILSGIAPGLSELGVMLPYTPLHLLLFHEAAGRPSGIEWLEKDSIDLTLVMTSANPSSEPLVTDNFEAYSRLGHIADAFIIHNRDIVTRCDDSVVRIIDNTPRLVRRARGYTPRAIPLDQALTGLIGTGAALKSTICVTRQHEAFVSQHIGDTDNLPTCQALQTALEHFLDLLEVAPCAIACDLHPDFYSTRLAQEFSSRYNLPLFSVQHHHAHIASVMAENHLHGDVFGIALDGVGLGTDGTIWGGELLKLDERGQFERIGHLKNVPLPGGDKASREPWRMGAALAWACGKKDAIAHLWPRQSHLPILPLINNVKLSPLTSSMGRLFDAASSIAGLCDVQHDEARAAMLLESAALKFDQPQHLQKLWNIDRHGVLDLGPLFSLLIELRLKKSPSEEIAHSFQSHTVAALADWAHCLVPSKATVCLAGGCFLNRYLATKLTHRLKNDGYRVYMPSSLPPGDAGISLGQCAVAASRYGILRS